MFNIGPFELLVILLVALLVVGPARLPQMGRNVGRSLRELRRAQDEVRRSLELDVDVDEDDDLDAPDDDLPPPQADRGAARRSPSPPLPAPGGENGVSGAPRPRGSAGE